MATIIGRKREMQLLEQYISSGRAEFVAIYGRRRVGKTFLVRQLFGGRMAFDITGIIEGNRAEQMAAFNDALKQHGYRGPKANTWLEAFFALRDLLKERISENSPCIVFIDELPSFDTPRSGFVKALGHFWNSWAAWQPAIKLIVCGSATSWMVRHIIDNHGGLHNRITHELSLRPFSLCEAEEFFRAGGFPWSRLGILHAYMAVGGVPYYLGLFSPDESPAQGIDRLFFSPDAEMQKEYRRLFYSLFRNPEHYIDIINVLAASPQGLTRDEISSRLEVDNNGRLGDTLTDLAYCDFIRRNAVKEKKIKANSAIYQLADLYTLFYHTFVQHRHLAAGSWTRMQGTAAVNAWLGLTFERICLAHVPQIKKALGIDGILTQAYSWRSRDAENAAQIDLLIERADKMINLCEIKYSEGEYRLQKEEYLKIARRVELFRQATHTRYGIVPTLITTFGLARGMHADAIHATVEIDDLFA